MAWSGSGRMAPSAPQPPNLPWPGGTCHPRNSHLDEGHTVSVPEHEAQLTLVARLAWCQAAVGQGHLSAGAKTCEELQSSSWLLGGQASSGGIQMGVNN